MCLTVIVNSYKEYIMSKLILTMYKTNFDIFRVQYRCGSQHGRQNTYV